MICAARESGAKRTDKGTAGENRCRKAMGLNGREPHDSAGLPKTENSPSSGPQGQEGGFFYEREEVRQALSHMGLSADDDPLAPASQRAGRRRGSTFLR